MHAIRRASCAGLCVLMVCLLGACSTLSTTSSVSVSQNQTFALLTFDNLSSTPRADERLRTLLETRLRLQGVNEVYVYTTSQPSTLRALLDTRSHTDDATRWAVNRGARYAMSGTVHEWQYQNGADSEPTVGITLSLVDLIDGSVLWQGNAARSGFGYANLSAVAEKTIADLLGKVTFTSGYEGAAQRRGE